MTWVFLITYIWGTLSVIHMVSVPIGGDSEYLKMPGVLELERHGGQVIEEMEKDYPDIRIGARTVELFSFKEKR